eukprot:CAMPEP_0196701572 /NCGR_PEP_ID=MMETSP1090-20130531/51800_1 /TAXON_ID=37098 /ORGANISM="Isochrysis sp, Strain CCMP1244" /LENGTH=100 /DNA_ID=CAMNT_0042041359 /DNA_START=98 /DNA_END=398 /DNA_ORIENTATION=+
MQFMRALPSARGPLTRSDGTAGGTVGVATGAAAGSDSEIEAKVGARLRPRIKPPTDHRVGGRDVAEPKARVPPEAVAGAHDEQAARLRAGAAELAVRDER